MFLEAVNLLLDKQIFMQIFSVEPRSFYYIHRLSFNKIELYSPFQTIISYIYIPTILYQHHIPEFSIGFKPKIEAHESIFQLLEISKKRSSRLG